MHGDDVRVVDVKGVFDALPDVGAAAEHAGAFGEGAGAGYGRFFKVSGEVGAVVGNAALGTVAVRHAVVHAQGRKKRAHGLTGLARVDEDAGAVQMGFGGEVKHYFSPTEPCRVARVFQGGVTMCHAGVK